MEEILNMHESLLLKLDSRGETALHLAAREGNYNVVEALINKAKSLLVQPDHLQDTSSTVVQFLIRVANVESETALHAACRNNYNNVVELLVTEDPSHAHPQNMYDETPLYLASIRGDAQLIKTIFDNCESPTFGGPEGRTALHAAILDQRDYGTSYHTVNFKFLADSLPSIISIILLEVNIRPSDPKKLIFCTFFVISLDHV